MMFQTILGQLISLAGSLVLGWLLLEEDFGLFALSMAIANAAALIQTVGLRDLLIHRYRRFNQWVGPATWIALFLGLASMIVMILAAPLVEQEWLYGKDGLMELMLILAIGMPFNALSVVPEAMVQAQMRFRLVALSRFLMAGGVMILVVLLALLGFGVYSFVIPRPIMQIVRLMILWKAASPPLRLRPQFRRWRYMTADLFVLSAANVSTYVTGQCDYVILGLFHSEQMVGVYYYAFSLSNRAIVLLTNNLRDVIFPALSSICGEPHRQAQAFLRASRLLTLAGVPFCLLQAAVAEPLFSALLPERWREGIPVLQILAFGTIFHLVGVPALSVLRAQGRFRMLLILSITMAIIFVLAVAVAAALGAIVAVSLAVAGHMVFSALIQIYVAVRHGGFGWRETFGVFSVPMTVGLLAVGTAWLAGMFVPESALQDWIQLALVPLLALALYVPLIILVAPGDWRDLIVRLRDLVQKRRRNGVPPTEQEQIP